MAILNDRDYRSILAFLEGLYGQADVETLPDWLLREAPNLVACHHCTWNEFAFSVPRAKVVEYPLLDRFDARLAAYSTTLFEHPGVVHLLSGGDAGPFVISDLVSEKEWHRRQLYQRVFRQMEYEDQIGMLLSPPRGEVAGLAVARDRRGFSERDRQVMALIRPHVALAHANLRARARARWRLDGEADGSSDVALLETGPDGEVWRGLSRAQALLTGYFRGERRRAAGELPPTLTRWLRHRPRVPLVVRRGERRLVARFFAATPRRGRAGLILIEDHVAPEAVLRLRAKGLTAREAQVLAELEKGLSNDDIAAALGISPRTVKKHLENIYAKLGVGNRTAATAWLRRVTT